MSALIIMMFAIAGLAHLWATIYYDHLTGEDHLFLLLSGLLVLGCAAIYALASAR